MFLREVFFLACLLLAALVPPTAAGELRYSGSIAPGGSSEEWQLGFSRSGESWAFHSQGVIVQEEGRIKGPVLKWQLSWDQDWASVRAGRGWHAFTEPSVFRIMHGNNVAEETSMLLASLGGSTAGMFSKLPLDNRLAGGAFILVEHAAPGLEFMGMHLRYDTGYSPLLERRAGQVAVLQGIHQWRGLTVTGALGRHRPAEGSASHGVFGRASYTFGKSSLNLEALRIEPGFESLFAASNRLTPNRQGFTVAFTHKGEDVSLEFQGRAHWNVEGSRTYPRLGLKGDFKRLGLTADLRVLPTAALIFTGKEGAATWQVDPLRQWLRVDWAGEYAGTRLNFDLPGGIVRLQAAFTFGSDWRLVWKRDFLRNLSHFSARARVALKRGAVQLEWGEYDRGNLRAGFGQKATWRISWEWQF